MKANNIHQPYKKISQINNNSKATNHNIPSKKGLYNRPVVDSYLNKKKEDKKESNNVSMQNKIGSINISKINNPGKSRGSKNLNSNENNNQGIKRKEEEIQQRNKNTNSYYEKYIKKSITENNQFNNEEKNINNQKKDNQQKNKLKNENEINNTYSNRSSNNNNIYIIKRKSKINDNKSDTQTAKNNRIVDNKKNTDPKEEDVIINKEKKLYNEKKLNQKEIKEEDNDFSKESKNTNIKNIMTGKKHKPDNKDALETNLQTNLSQKKPQKENIIKNIKNNTNENKNKIQDANILEEDIKNKLNKKDLNEAQKDTSKRIEISEVNKYKTSITKNKKKDDDLEKESQNSSNKKEVNEVNKVNKDTSKDSQNTNIAKDINGFKHQSDKKDVLEEDKPNNSFKKEVKEEKEDTQEECENKTQIKNKDKKDEFPQISKFANIKKIDKPIKIKDPNLKTFQNDTNNEKTNNDIKSLVPEAEKHKKKDPKQSRYTSTYNRTIKKKEDNTEDINNILPEKSRQELSKPGLIGLKNIGATCYMNATLQCFSNCPSFKNNLLKLYKELETGKDSKYKLSFALAEVIKNLWEILHHKIYEPNNFKNIISEMNPTFKGIAANDPKDLVLFIIQTIHIELNKPNPNFESNEGNNYVAFWKEYNDFMDFYKRQNNSITTEEFHFYTNNMSTCCNCNTTIHNVQTNNILFFPLEEVRKFKRIYNNNVTIYDCFEYNEMQTSSNFHCNSCNYDTMCYSCTKFVSSSKTLIINLNRGHGMEYNVNIVFEEYLNIRKFVFKSESPYYYELTGVICHFGDNDDSGHFIAYCKNCDDCNWYKFNDGFITKCSFQDVKKKGMHYVLFYSYIQMED